MTEPEGQTMRERIAGLFDRLSTQQAARPDEAGRTASPDSVPAGESHSREDIAATVPWFLRVSAAWSWRFLVVVAAAVVIVWGMSRIPGVLMPVAIAMLLTVFLAPMVTWATRHLHMGRTLASALVLIGTILVVVAVVGIAGNSVFNQFPRLLDRASRGFQEVVDWLANGPFGLDTSTIEQWMTDFQSEISDFLQSNSQTIAAGALSVGTSLVAVITGLLVALFCLFFFLKEGRTIWLWAVRMLPAPARTPIHEAAIRGWVTIAGYVTTQIKVAAIDAAGIGLGAFFLGLPMVLPITVLVFFGSFIPIIGAFLSGAIAVFVAIVDQNLTAGIIMLAIILAVQQIEGNVLQPWLMSDAVSLHPVAVLLVVTGAGSVAGIVGAVLGVPIAAFINAAVLYLHGHDPLPELQMRRDRPGGPPGTLHLMVAATYRDAAPADVEAAHAVDEAAADDESTEQPDDEGRGGAPEEPDGQPHGASATVSSPGPDGEHVPGVEVGDGRGDGRSPDDQNQVDPTRDDQRHPGAADRD